MTTSDQNSSEQPDLFATAVAGELTYEQCAELEALLLNNPDVQDEFAGYCRFEGDLRLYCRSRRVVDEALSIIIDEKPADLSGVHKRYESVHWQRHKVRFSTLSAVLTALAWIGFGSVMWLSTLPSESRPVRQGEDFDFVAYISGRYKHEWSEDMRPMPPNASMAVGERLDLVEGLVEITFFDGAVVVLEAPTEFVIDSRGAGTLNAGRLSAYVPERAIGFVIDTPIAHVVDLGTRFSVVVDENETTVGVHEGRVALQYGDRPAMEVAADQGWSCERGGMPRIIAYVEFDPLVMPELTGVVAAWTFEHDFTADFGGAAFDLTAANGATAGVSGGKFGNAASFDRVFEQYAFTSGNVLTQWRDHSYSAWYKLNVTDITGKDRYFILETTAGDTPSNTLGYTASLGLLDMDGVDIGQVHTRTEGTGDTSLDIAGGNDNSGVSQWHNIIVTYDANDGDESGVGRHTVYLDGSLVGTFGNDEPLTAVEGLVIGGHRNGTGRNFDGLIDDVAFFNHVLNDSEIIILQSTSAVPVFHSSTPDVTDSADAEERKEGSP